VRENFAIRLGTLDDAETVVAHRRAMFLEMGYPDDHAMKQMCAEFGPWLARRMRAGEYLAWFAVDANGTIAAGVGLWLMDWPPHMIDSVPTRGNILNVYTRPESRRLGLARKLMDTALAWCLLNRVRAVILHASKDGRPLYESLGFETTNEMRIVLELDKGTSA
jgi:GNAT superfamily N-acetyltransferase